MFFLSLVTKAVCVRISSPKESWEKENGNSYEFQQIVNVSVILINN